MLELANTLKDYYDRIEDGYNASYRKLSVEKILEYDVFYKGEYISYLQEKNNNLVKEKIILSLVEKIQDKTIDSLKNIISEGN